MVGSARTCQPAAAARRSQARRRARPAYDAGVHLRPWFGTRQQPLNHTPRTTVSRRASERTRLRNLNPLVDNV